MVVEKLKEKTLEALRGSVDAPEVGTIDGVKLGYEDGSWVLFRPSGTEPVFRIYAEAGSPERVDKLIGEHKELVESIIASLGL